MLEIALISIGENVLVEQNSAKYNNYRGFFRSKFVYRIFISDMARAS